MPSMASWIAAQSSTRHQRKSSRVLNNRHAQRGDELGAGVDLRRPLGRVKPVLISTRR
jgi:hypothetical protein